MLASGTTRRRPAIADVERRQRRRARRQVPSGRRRLHHRRPLLQGRGEHRHARRQPVDRRRARCSRRRRSPARRASGWQQVDLRRAGRDRREHDLRRLVPHARRALRVRRRLLRRRRRRQRPLHALGERRRRAERRLPLRRRAAFPTDTFNGANYWVDVVFETDGRARHDAADRRSTRPGRGATGVALRRDRDGDVQRGARRRRRSTAATFELRDGANALVPATVTYDAGNADRDAHADRRRSPRRASYTATRARRRQRRHGRGRQRAGGRRHLDVHDRRAAAAAADRGPRRTDPGRRERGESVQPLLRRDPARRRPERVRGDGHLARSTPAVLAATTSSSSARCRSARRRSTMFTRLGERRRQPDRDAARQAARGLLGLTRRGGTLRERLPADRHRRRARARASSAQTIQFHGDRRPLHAQRRDDGRDALHDATTPTSNPAVTLRSVGSERRPGGGVHLRPRALGRLHAPGQSRLGRPGARRQSRRSAPTTCSSAAPRDRSPTGSTSTRSRSRRPTSSSACSPT